MKRREPRERMEKMYKERRKVYADKLRHLAIQEDWFNEADNEEYSAWLDYSHKENITAEDLEEMAEMVFEHTDEETMRDYQYDYEPVMFAIANECCQTLFERM